jgi:predicted ATP-grasp superfamily ATP-dependent carboligase
VNIYQRALKQKIALCAGKDTAFQMPVVYGQKVHKLRYENYEIFEADLNKICKYYANEKLVYVAASERTTVFFYQYLRNNEPTQFLHSLPSEESFTLARNKGEFQKFCETHEFPVPKSYGPNQLEQLKANFRPVVYKPKHGQGSVGIRYYENLEAFNLNPPKDFETYLLQEKVICSQQVTGSFFLCDRGKVITAHCHQRVRTFPVEGGVTVFSQSTYNEEIIKIGAELLAALQWNGVAMIEFMFDEPTQQWKIIELNPRLWGSLMLSQFNNSGLLQGYADLALGREVKPATSKPEPVYIRWFFPFEVLNFVKRDISFSEFMNLKRLKICYINWTYSSYYRSLLYWVYFAFNFSSISRFIKKLAR